MALTQARDTIVCPKCGGRRIVTLRQRRRAISRGGILCGPCRGGRRISDEDFRWWLTAYDTDVPEGMTAREFIAAGGAPAALVELAQTVFPRHYS